MMLFKFIPNVIWDWHGWHFVKFVFGAALSWGIVLYVYGCSVDKSFDMKIMDAWILGMKEMQVFVYYLFNK